MLLITTEYFGVSALKGLYQHSEITSGSDHRQLHLQALAGPSTTSYWPKSPAARPKFAYILSITYLLNSASALAPGCAFLVHLWLSYPFDYFIGFTYDNIKDF